MEKQIGDTLRTGNLPKTKLCTASPTMTGARHCLYLNEWDGHFLCIDGNGAVTRHTNGEFDLLFLMGDSATQDGPNTNMRGPGADLDRRRRLDQARYGSGVFSESIGLQRHHAMNVLIAWLLAVMVKGGLRLSHPDAERTLRGP